MHGRGALTCTAQSFSCLLVWGKTLGDCRGKACTTGNIVSTYSFSLLDIGGSSVGSFYAIVSSCSHLLPEQGQSDIDGNTEGSVFTVKGFPT